MLQPACRAYTFSSLHLTQTDMLAHSSMQQMQIVQAFELQPLTTAYTAQDDFQTVTLRLNNLKMLTHLLTGLKSM